MAERDLIDEVGLEELFGERDLMGELESLVEEAKILNGASASVKAYQDEFGSTGVSSAFEQLEIDGKIKALHPLGTTKETITSRNTYYVSLTRR